MRAGAVGDVQCSLCVLQSLAMNGGFGLVQCRFAGVPLLSLLNSAMHVNGQYPCNRKPHSDLPTRLKTVENWVANDSHCKTQGCPAPRQHNRLWHTNRMRGASRHRAITPNAQPR